jgi:Zn-dependent protease
MEDYDLLANLVGRHLKIEDITLGDGKDQPYLVRYRGRLYNEDTVAAYDDLTLAVKPYGLTPLFRWDDKRHAVMLVSQLPKPTPSNPRTNLIMFILTLIAVLWTGGVTNLHQPLPEDPIQAIGVLISAGWPFAVSLLAILGAHELGHYFVGRHHGVNVTLPYFIPFPYPLGLFGTMGAFINMKEYPKNKRILLDIGLAGPFAGLVVAVPVLLLGLSLSKVSSLGIDSIGTVMEGNSLLYLGLKYLSFGQLLPAPLTYGETSPLLYWIGYFFTGRPSPLGGVDVSLHPVAWAGWAGLLVTMLNLIPAGQLDGGHVLLVLFGREGAKKFRRVILVLLVLLGLVWTGWWIWALLIYFMGSRSAEPLDQITELDHFTLHPGAVVPACPARHALVPLVG